MFQHQIEHGSVTIIGHCSPIYATVYWLENGIRAKKTICHTPQDLADTINHRTMYSKGRAFEIEYRPETIQA